MPEVKILRLLMKQVVLARNDPEIIGLFRHLRFDLVVETGAQSVADRMSQTLPKRKLAWSVLSSVASLRIDRSSSRASVGENQRRV